jgi:hypothetical protein
VSAATTPTSITQLCFCCCHSCADRCLPNHVSPSTHAHTATSRIHSEAAFAISSVSISLSSSSTCTSTRPALLSLSASLLPPAHPLLCLLLASRPRQFNQTHAPQFLQHGSHDPIWAGLYCSDWRWRGSFIYKHFVCSSVPVPSLKRTKRKSSTRKCSCFLGLFLVKSSEAESKYCFIAPEWKTGRKAHANVRFSVAFPTSGCSARFSASPAHSLLSCFGKLIFVLAVSSRRSENTFGVFPQRQKLFRCRSAARR